MVTINSNSANDVFVKFRDLRYFRRHFRTEQYFSVLKTEGGRWMTGLKNAAPATSQWWPGRRRWAFKVIVQGLESYNRTIVFHFFLRKIPLNSLIRHTKTLRTNARMTRIIFKPHDVNETGPRHEWRCAMTGTKMQEWRELFSNHMTQMKLD